MPHLPPGPRIAVLQSLGYMRDPYAFYRSLVEQYGDPVSIPTLNGLVVATGHPDGIKEIFSARPETFGVFGPDALTPLVGERSLLVVEGETHRTRRKLMIPPFHGERMHVFGQRFAAIARKHADRLIPGVPFRMQQVTTGITLDAIVQLVFGVTDPATQERFSNALALLIDRVDPLGIFLTFLRREHYGPWARFVAARKDVDALIAGELARRRANGADGQDILSMLMAARYDDGTALSDAELRDQLITLLSAGHETTSTALAWAFYWLDRHPEVRARLIEEAAPLGPDPDPRAVAGLSYLDAFCHEVLRLNPIVPDVVRALRAPFTLRGFELPAGVNVAAAITLAHTNPETFPDPYAFKPERFVGKTYSPFTYLPFGGGARRCLGAAFALYEMKIVLHTLLAEYRLQRTSNTPIVATRRNITMGPKGGVEMVRTDATRARPPAVQEQHGAA